MARITTPQLQDRAASVLHIWRNAAEAIQTDSDLSRRQAYAEAIAAVSANMPDYTSVDDLITYYWSGRMQASAALVSISRRGHILNDQVIAAAACWQAMHQPMKQAS